MFKFNFKLFIGYLQPRWRIENIKSGIPSTGFCYAAAEAAFHLLGGKKAGWKPMCVVYYEDGIKSTHWWIVKDGKIIDPTKSQYTKCGLKPPYHLGKGCGFLSKNPSKLAKLLIESKLHNKSYSAH